MKKKITIIQKPYAYWVGALEGAARIALIYLKHGQIEAAAYALRKALTQVDEDIAKTPERTEQ
jgi:hypothetical protein